MDAQDILKEVGDVEKTIEKRTDKIINWIKKPNNLIFTLILVFALVIRLYYFFMTQNQPLWWDEAEYMGMARAWALGLEYEFLSVRPILFSLITALLLKIAYNEFLPRVLIFIFSILSVIGMYYLGKELYNKKVGFLSAFLMSIFYINLFFSFRLLVELPSLTSFIFAGFFFWKYFKNNANKKSLYLAAIIAAIGTLFRLSTALILFTVLIYVLITERLKFLKKKEYWIAALIFFLVLSPYIIWGYLQFNGFVITQAMAWSPPQGNYMVNGITQLKGYLNLFPTYLSWPLLIIFILGLFSFYKFFLGFDLLLKKGNDKLKRDLFVFLLFIIPLVLVSFSTSHNENRYILNAFPAIFIISSLIVFSIFNFIKKKNKFFAVILFIVFIVFTFNFQFKATDQLIKEKINSYDLVKEAGLWLKDNSQPEDIIVTKSWPQIQVYAERQAIRLPDTKEEFESLIDSNSNMTILMVSIYEPHQDWAYVYPQENNLTPIKVYFADAQNTQPGLIIYKL